MDVGLRAEAVGAPLAGLAFPSSSHAMLWSAGSNKNDQVRRQKLQPFPIGILGP